MFDVQRFISNVKKKDFFLIKTFVDSRNMIIFADHFRGLYQRDGLHFKFIKILKKSRRSSAVEHVICNLGVGGPNPSAGSNLSVMTDWGSRIVAIATDCKSVLG